MWSSPLRAYLIGISIVSERTPPGVACTSNAPRHVLAQLHGLAVADVPVLLQVLRLRYAQGAPLLAGRGGRAARRGGQAARQGAARAHRREAGGQRRGPRTAA